MISFLRLMIFTLALSSTSAAEKAIRVVVDSAWNSPQVIYQDGHPVAGVFIELFAQIAKNLNAQLKLQVLPRKRLLFALEKNQADVLCHINPKWLDTPLPVDRWSGPFLPQENVIIQAPNHPIVPINLEQTSHLNLGTVLGYQYPKIADAIRRGIIRRIDSPNQAVLLKNTQDGKLPYSIANRINVDYFNRELAPEKKLTIVQTLDVQTTYCLFAPEPQIPHSQIRAAIAQLHSDKQIEAILQRYRISSK
ncbi:transporter substrate-binding domain-containing protein [Chitinibacter sp. SCUT-21]|uniref:substrate-binding periplasmic protein n=1 Tax=Chitinibacter sp. SCUT-21 TaxID=2970891 RepID=UPI0035A6B12E